MDDLLEQLFTNNSPTVTRVGLNSNPFALTWTTHTVFTRHIVIAVMESLLVALDRVHLRRSVVVPVVVLLLVVQLMVVAAPVAATTAATAQCRRVAVIIVRTRRMRWRDVAVRMIVGVHYGGSQLGDWCWGVPQEHTDTMRGKEMSGARKARPQTLSEGFTYDLHALLNVANCLAWMGIRTQFGI